MARVYGKLKKSLWSEPEWLKLSTDAQWLYGYLVSQPNTDTAGVFPLQLTKWAKAACDNTYERVVAAAKALSNGDWIAVDHDTEEGLIRHYIADQVSGTNVFISALGRAGLAQSAYLREQLLEEILKLDKEFSEREQELVDELADSLPVNEKSTPTASSTSIAITTGVQTPSKHRSDAVPTSSQRRSNAVRVEPGECLRCRQAQAIGTEAEPGENQMWCGPCNDERPGYES